MTAKVLVASATDRVAALWASLEATGVDWCLLRPARDTPDDIDVLVAAGGLDRVLAALRAGGLVEEPGYGRGSHRFLLGYVDRAFLRVDLVTRLDFGPLHCIRSGMAERCLARRIRFGGGWTLYPADELWVTALHLLADDGTDPADRYRLDRLTELAEIVGRSLEDGSWLSVVQPLLPSAVDGADLVELLRGQGPGTRERQSLVALREPMRRNCLLTCAHHRRDAVRLLTAALLRGTERPRQWRGRRGVLATVLGPDGAGKSTVIREVGESWPWPHQRIYFGLWPDVREPRRLSASFWPLRRPLRAMNRYVLGVLAGSRGRLVLFDRYVYDAAVPPRGGRLRLKRLYFSVLLRCAPAPDVAVLLDAPGEVLYARKGELDPAVLEADRQALAGHLERLGRRVGRPQVVVVDATRSRDEVLDAVTNALWQVAATRLERSAWWSAR